MARQLEQRILHVGDALGGVPLIGHCKQLNVYIDETLVRFEIVYSAAGTAIQSFRLHI